MNEVLYTLLCVVAGFTLFTGLCMVGALLFWFWYQAYRLVRRRINTGFWT